jgi:hypothetical protein
MAKFFLYDESMTSAKAKITTKKLATMGDIVAPEKAFIYADGKDAPNTLHIMGGLLLAVGNSIFETIAMTVTVEDLDSGAAFEIGTDYCVYICDPTNGDETVDGDEVFKVSKSSTYPSGYTAANSRKIGGFHYGVVRRVNEQGNPVNSSGAERGSGWESCVYNGILPNSVWTVLHRPKCDPAGMCYIGGGLWGDIYLSSDDGADGLQSAYGENPITGTEGLDWYIANEKARRVGKRLPSYAEFCQAAFGSPEGVDENNTNAWSAMGNTSRAKCGSVKNAVSAVNIRDLVGNVWKWCDEFCLDQTLASWGWKKISPTGHGYAYSTGLDALVALMCGGCWGDGNHAGDRAVACRNYPTFARSITGVWCVCDSQ